MCQKACSVFYVTYLNNFNRTFGLCPLQPSERLGFGIILCCWLVTSLGGGHLVCCVGIWYTQVFEL
jgi:hypothetical protein